LLRNRDEISFENDRAESFTLGQRNRSWFNRHKISICLSIFFVTLNLVSCFLVYTWFQQRYAHYPFLGDSKLSCRIIGALMY
jgi:hypothetical protein